MTMENDLKRMATRRGFIEVFWERLRADRKEGGSRTRRDIYNQMEQEHEAYYDGESRFPSYDAFRKALERGPQ